MPPFKRAPNAEGMANAVDLVIHSPARLRILTVLKEVEHADFLFILRQTGLTRGNLSSHLSKLEAARYVVITKEFIGKLPHTIVRLSAEGQEALETYRQRMQITLDRLR